MGRLWNLCAAALRLAGAAQCVQVEWAWSDLLPSRRPLDLRGGLRTGRLPGSTF